MYGGERIRLNGNRLDGLTEHVMYQESIFENPDYRYKLSKIDSVVDDINKKYGEPIIKKAALLQR